MNNDKPNTRGGSREGAGRKRFDDEPQKRRNISLSDRLADKATDIGGNVSGGIREALESHGVAIALFTSPDWEELLALFTAHGVEGHEMRCQKHNGVWHGQIYKV